MFLVDDLGPASMTQTVGVSPLLNPLLSGIYSSRPSQKNDVTESDLPCDAVRNYAQFLRSTGNSHTRVCASEGDNPCDSEEVSLTREIT